MFNLMPFRVLFFVLITIASFAFEKSDMSVGVALGTPTGLSAKYQLDSLNHLQSDIGSNYFAADYMWKHPYDFNVENLSWYYGAGIAYKEQLGGRVVASVEYKFQQSPFTAFANHSFNLTDKARLAIAVGCRFHF